MLKLEMYLSVTTTNLICSLTRSSFYRWRGWFRCLLALVFNNNNTFIRLIFLREIRE